jgi:Cu(I)/Ag(I) efflux system membrane protein CusA/SilA
MASQLGVRLADVQELVRHAIGGEAVAETFQGRQRIPIQVRFPREYRDDPEAIESLWLNVPSGQVVPLNQVADLEFRQGPPMIRSEGGQLTTYVFVDTEVASATYIEKAQTRLEEELQLSTGVRYVWAGQFASLQRAEKTLQQVVPLTLLLVLVLLYRNTRSLTESLLVLCAVPFSLIGAICLLYVFDYSLSVAVWVGMIALMGLDAETGVVMLLYLKLSWSRAETEGRLNHPTEHENAILEGAAQRLRPKLMTVTTTMLGLLPLLWSQGTGADLMKRVAAPMVGGLVSSFVLELLVYPALFAIWKTRSLRSAR